MSEALTNLSPRRKLKGRKLVNRHHGKSPSDEGGLKLLLGTRLPQKWFRALELRWRLDTAMTYDEIGESLGLSSSRAAQIENRARRLLRQIIWTGYRIHCLKSRRQIESISINELSLDARSHSALMTLGVSTIGNLAAIAPCQLLAVKNFGMTSLDRLRSALAVFGLDLMRCPIHGMCCASCKETGGKWVSRFNPAIGKLEQVRPWVCAQD